MRSRVRTRVSSGRAPVRSQCVGFRKRQCALVLGALEFGNATTLTSMRYPEHSIFTDIYRVRLDQIGYIYIYISALEPAEELEGNLWS